MGDLDPRPIEEAVFREIADQVRPSHREKTAREPDSTPEEIEAFFGMPAEEVDKLITAGMDEEFNREPGVIYGNGTWVGNRTKDMDTMRKLCEDNLLAWEQYVRLVTEPVQPRTAPDAEEKSAPDEPERPSFWRAVWELTEYCIPIWIMLGVFAIMSHAIARMFQLMFAPEITLIRYVIEGVLMFATSCGLFHADGLTLRGMERVVRDYGDKFREYREYLEQNEN